MIAPVAHHAGKPVKANQLEPEREPQCRYDYSCHFRECDEAVHGRLLLSLALCGAACRAPHAECECSPGARYSKLSGKHLRLSGVSLHVVKQTRRGIWHSLQAAARCSGLRGGPSASLWLDSTVQCAAYVPCKLAEAGCVRGGAGRSRVRCRLRSAARRTRPYAFSTNHYSQGACGCFRCYLFHRRRTKPRNNRGCT